MYNKVGTDVTVVTIAKKYLGLTSCLYFEYEVVLELGLFGFVIFEKNIFNRFGLVIDIEIIKPISYFGYFSL